MDGRGELVPSGTASTATPEGSTGAWRRRGAPSPPLGAVHLAISSSSPLLGSHSPTLRRRGTAGGGRTARAARPPRRPRDPGSATRRPEGRSSHRDANMGVDSVLCLDPEQPTLSCIPADAWLRLHMRLGSPRQTCPRRWISDQAPSKFSRDGPISQARGGDAWGLAGGGIQA